jgi:phosphodiesterase/alkaline phosphatase D-like protein
MRPVRVTRRELVAAGAAGAALAAVPPAWAARLLDSTPRVGPGEFVDGVASGEPGASAVTLWSRLQTDRPRSGARLVVARDEEMRRVVATTVVPTGRGVNGTLKARIDGLEPDTQYWYAWESGTGSSPVGRTRTAPALGSGRGVRIGVSSCQLYPAGYFNAHADAAQRDLDLYLFLGDYIYETDLAAGTPYPRADAIEAVDLASYRRKYQLYRSDAGLRELHRMHPALHVWDDHEIADNYSDNNPAPSAAQRAAGYRVAFEWLPRIVFPRERDRIYKRISYGKNVDIFLLDTRGRRSGDHDGQERHILDEAQMRWLIRELKASTARWKVIAQQVVVATIYFGPATNSDAWDGYPEDRARLLGEIERAGIDDVVFLTGDVHVFMANLLASDFAALGDGSSRKPAAVEYVAGSITSPGVPLAEPALQAQAPWNKQYDGVQHGYATLDLDPHRMATEYLTSAYLVPGGPTATFERFTQPAGENRIERQRLPAALGRTAQAQRARS